MVRSPKTLGWVGSLLALGVATPAFAQPTEMPAAPEVAEPVDNSAAYFAMGYAMARQLRLDIGFDEEQMDDIVAGVRSLAAGEPEPEDFQASVQAAQQIYMGLMQAKRAEEEAAKAAQAEANLAEAEAYFAELATREGVEKTESGLYYEIIEPGDGAEAGPRDRVTVNYAGRLIDGREFDSGEGASFSVAGVVPGFGEGLQLLKEGGSAVLYIPAELGYGNNPRPGGIIEAGDALIFEIDLVEVTPAPAAPAGAPNMPAGMPPNMRPPGPPPSGPPPTRPPGPPPNMTPPPPPPNVDTEG